MSVNKVSAVRLTKINSGQTRLRTRWRGDERKKKSEKKREGGRSLNLPYHLYN
jgi:hypothetical protein